MELIETRRGRRNKIVAFGLAVFMLAISQAIVARQADAFPTGCSGSIVRGPDGKGSWSYAFTCIDQVKAYTLTSNLDIDSFNPEVGVTNDAGAPVSGESFTCEGDVPSPGFTCFGDTGATAGHHVRGSFTTDGLPCGVNKRLRVWLSVSGSGTRPPPAPSGTHTVAAGPISLITPKCKKKPKHVKHHGDGDDGNEHHRHH